MHFDVKSSGEATPRWTMGGYRAEHHANELIFHVPSIYRGVDVLSDDTITTLHIKGVNIFGNTEIEFSEVEGDPTVAVGRYLIPRSITSSVGEYLASLKFVGADGVVAKSGTIRFLISDVVDADDDVIGDSDPNIIEQLSVRIAQSISDAPSDGLSYVRKDGEWVEVDLSVGGGGDVTKVYVDTQDISTLIEAKEYVDSVGSQVYLDAKAYVDSLPTPDVDKTYVDSADQSILSQAKDYTDSKPSGDVTKVYVDERDNAILSETMEYADSLPKGITPSATALSHQTNLTADFSDTLCVTVQMSGDINITLSNMKVGGRYAIHLYCDGSERLATVNGVRWIGDLPLLKPNKVTVITLFNDGVTTLATATTEV